MQLTRVRRPIGAVLAIALSLIVAACLFAPGKFASDLTVAKDGSFTFKYTGELFLLPLAKPSQPLKFDPQPCYNDDGYEERECSKAEIDKQRLDWDVQQKEKARSDARAAQFLFGGVDPSDPKAGAEIADRLRRQSGWKSVDYRGNGKFDVDFEISGTLDHDFAFPTIEQFPMANALVQVSLRSDGTVRIDAPGFGPSAGPMGASGMMRGLMQGAATRPDSSEADDGSAADEPAPNPMDGVFGIHTDAEILANNTDVGPKPEGNGKVLRWVATPSAQAAPMALLKLTP